MKAAEQRQSVINVCWARYMAFSAFGLILFGIKLWLIGSYGNATPFWDQWDAEAASLYEPFLAGTLNLANLFAPHNEHRIFTTRLLALALLTINDIWNPLLQMVVNAILHIITLGFGIVLLTRVIGRDHLPALLVFSLVLFGVPYAWENTLAGFQSQFYFVLLFSIASMWLTVVYQPLSVQWWGGVVCAILAFFSLASGVFSVAAAAIVGLVYYGTGLRKTRKQLLAVAILAGLFILGALLTPSLAHHAALKAASLPQFFDALMAVLSWPVPTHFFSALVRNMPALVFAGLLLWKRPPATDRRWFLLALVVWVFGQAVSIAYGRAVSSLSSRYLDLFAIGILVNFACLLYIGRVYMDKKRGWTITGVSMWIILVLISLGMNAGKHIQAELQSKRDTSHAQEINTRNYLATGDSSHLKNKPYLHVPYPVTEHLVSILDLPRIQAILPTVISRPLEPVSIESRPGNAFVADGYYPTTPAREGMTTGSYSSQGDAATGQAALRFYTNRQSSLLAIPVAGYPLSSGIKLEFEQNGLVRPVNIKRNPKESWADAYIKVGKGEFTINLVDSSTTTWLAVGAPAVTGRLDELTSKLLANYRVFILLGIVAVVLLLTQCGLKNVTDRSAVD